MEKARHTSAEQFAQILIDKVFGLEPENLMKTLRQGIDKDDVDPEEKAETQKFISMIKPYFYKDFTDSMDVDQKGAIDEQEMQTKVHELPLQVKNFIEAIGKLKDHQNVMFNKDDHVAVEFVTAATNIRASNFSIGMESLFKIKEMAGKIVPAISSSNALAASLQVLECIKLLEKNYKAIKGIVYQRANPTARLTSFARLNDVPNPECQVCADDSLTIVLLQISDLAGFALKDLKEKVLTDKTIGLGLTGQTFMIEFEGNIIYEYDKEVVDGADDDEDELEEIKINEKRLLKTFSEVKVLHQSIIQVQGAVSKAEPEASETREANFYIQILENKELGAPLMCEILKKGDLSKNF